jgi:hypothetical protein
MYLREYLCVQFDTSEIIRARNADLEQQRQEGALNARRHRQRPSLGDKRIILALNAEHTHNMHNLQEGLTADLKMQEDYVRQRKLQRLSERMSRSATDPQLSGAAQINDARARAPMKERPPPSAKRRAKSFGGF